MVGFFHSRRSTPIGVDIGTHSVKLLQLNAERSGVLEVARCDLPDSAGLSDEVVDEQLAEAIRRTRLGRNFVGREAVVCLGADELFVQNIRVAKSAGLDLEAVVREEASTRLPYPVEEAELRYLEAGDVRQGEATRRELILLGCHRPRLERKLQVIQHAGLRPVAVDAEPLALLRCYAQQYRRDEDKRQCAMLVHVGAHRTCAVIAQADAPLFIKYIDVSGQQFDEAVARHLKMPLAEAAHLRRKHGERRTGQQDREVARCVSEALRGALDRLASELSLCLRYHSVTFRGQPVARMLVGGGEATSELVESFATRVDVPCELGEPLRSYQPNPVSSRHVQWDVAAGLALREVSRPGTARSSDG